jgi:hypothetical protein
LSLLYGKYNFSCVFKTEALLPAYKGSTFRGALGWSLKNTICALKQKNCNSCIIKKECIYIKIFDPALAYANKENFKNKPIPNPFVIEPPLEEKRLYRKNDTFEFKILLFGKANNYLPYFIYAADKMGEIGIGEKIESERGKFKLKSAAYNNQIIYSSKNENLKILKDLPDITIFKPENTLNKTRKIKIRIKINIKTPLRIKIENHLQSELPFYFFVKAMLRRASSLISYYGDTPLHIDYTDIIKKASNIKTVEYDIKWCDFIRYSSRQKNRMFLGGIKGSVIYEGDLNPFIGLINFCEKTHLGKQTSFGLGQIEADLL